jgi:hypothetical protein
MTEKLLDRIGALLAKAESTDSPAEAEALVAKAQQLATLHAIDLATARERTARRHRRETPAQRKVRIGRRREMGLRHRVQLLIVIAHVNDVRLDIARDNTYVLAFGFPGDLEVVETMYVSLATQMVGAANAAIARGEHREEVYWSENARVWRSDARVFRSSFNTGFVGAVGERLQAARQDALAADDRKRAASNGSGGGAALVLARKADEVDAYHRATSDARGSWQGWRQSSVAWSLAGHDSGHAAGRRARLRPATPLPGARGQIRG